MKLKAAFALLTYSLRITEINVGNWIRADYKRSIGIVGLALYAGLFSWLVRQSYFAVDGLTWLGVVLFPYVVIIRQKQIYSFRYGILLVSISLLSLWIPARTLQFGLLAVGILFVIESFLGKINVLPLLWMGILSPFFRYTSIIFSFPIRLQLSAWAGKILAAVGFENEILGNVVRVGDTEFAVDVACMGLQMTEMALLVALFLVAHYERTTQRQLNVFWLAGIAAFTLVLNTLSNLLRILLLIVFHVLPDSPMHDALGLACLVVYVLLPVAFAIRWLYQKQGKIVSFQSAKSRLMGQSYIFSGGVSLFVLGLVVTQIFIRDPKLKSSSGIAKPHLPGFPQQVTTDGITQFSNPTMLVYVKPIADFYVAEHSPLICWRGSGYRFSRVEKQTVQGTEVYTGILQKDNDRIYSAWWFDNGTHRTTDQFDWRWRMLRGERNFCLVNVNVNRQEELNAAVQQVLTHKLSW